MNTYSFNVFWSDGDEGYVAICPEFPGLSAFGETPDEALAEVRIALEGAIEIYQNEGWSLPEPRVHRHTEYSGQFRVRLPKHLHAKLAAQAEEEGVSLNSLIIAFLSQAIGERNVASEMRKTLNSALGQWTEEVVRKLYSGTKNEIARRRSSELRPKNPPWIYLTDRKTSSEENVSSTMYVLRNRPDIVNRYLRQRRTEQ